MVRSKTSRSSTHLIRGPFAMESSSSPRLAPSTTTAKSPRWAVAWPLFPSIHAWAACWSRPTGMAVRQTSSSLLLRCRFRTPGNGHPNFRRPPTSHTAATSTPPQTSSHTSTCGVTWAFSHVTCRAAPSAECANGSSSTTCVTANGATSPNNCGKCAARWGFTLNLWACRQRPSSTHCATRRTPLSAPSLSSGAAVRPLMRMRFTAQSSPDCFPTLACGTNRNGNTRGHAVRASPFGRDLP